MRLRGARNPLTTRVGRDGPLSWIRTPCAAGGDGARRRRPSGPSGGCGRTRRPEERHRRSAADRLHADPDPGGGRGQRLVGPNGHGAVPFPGHGGISRTQDQFDVVHVAAPDWAPRDSQVASWVIGEQLSLVGAEFRGPRCRKEIKAKMGSFSFRTGGPVIHAPTLAASPNRHSRARHSLWAGS